MTPYDRFSVLTGIMTNELSCISSLDRQDVREHVIKALEALAIGLKSAQEAKISGELNELEFNYFVGC